MAQTDRDPAGTDTAPTYRQVLAVRDYRVMWAAELLSVAGDQLARVALSLLVFDRTGSAGLTGLTYGLTFLPTLLGTLTLAGFADHFPRRNVMIVADLARTVLIAAVAIPHLPLWLLCVLVASSTLFNGPYKAAQQAVLPDVLPDRLYVLGMSLRTVSIQVAQLAGFALGGVAITTLTPSGGLVADAGTFAASALLLGLTRARPVRPVAGQRPMSRAGLARGFAAYRHDRRLLVLLGVTALNLFHIVPEGTAAAFAHQLHARSWAVALILASAPLGAAVGAFVFGRLVPPGGRRRAFAVSALGAGAVLVPVLAPIGLAGCLVLFAVAGGCSAIYSMYAQALTVRLAAPAERGRIAGVSTATLHTCNGLGPMLGGLVAGALTPRIALGGAGLLSLVLAAGLTAAWLRVAPAGEAEPLT